MLNKVKQTKVLVLEGDGIGPEVIASAVQVINYLKEKLDLKISLDYGYIGGAAIDKFGTPLPKETIKKSLKYKVVLLGAVGGKKWENHPNPPEKGLLELRKKLKVFANLRPIQNLLPNKSKNIDILFVRELTGGLYFAKPKKRITNKNQVLAIDTLKYSDKEIERIVRLSFEIARNRRKFLVSVDKANVLESSKLWREVVNKISQEYPDVKVEHNLVDSFAMNLILKPEYFDVVVTENMFGDILTDEAAVLVGSLGLIPSASLSSANGLYEPIHGSAPDIAGKNIANPIGTILSVALMFKYSLKNDYIHNLVYQAVEKTLNQGYYTKDINPESFLSTSEITEKIIKNITIS